MDKYNNKAIDIELQGPYRTICKVCAWGLHDIVEEEAKKGKNFMQIKQALYRKAPAYYKLAKIDKLDIKKHLAHSTIPMENLRMARRARRDMLKEKKSASEIQESMLDVIGRILDLADSIKDDDIKNLSVKEKLRVIQDYAKIFQTDKKIAIDASKSKREEFAFLKELGAAAMEPINVKQIEPPIEQEDFDE